MPMKHNRRTFLGLGSLAACGVALNAPSLFKPAARVLPGGGAPVAEGAAVLDFVRGYSSNYHVIETPLHMSGSRALHVLAEIADVSRLCDAFARMPAARIHAQGNTLRFTIADLEVSVENLVPELFAARMGAQALPVPANAVS